MILLLTTDGQQVKAIEMAGSFLFLSHRYKAGSVLLLSTPRRVLTPSDLKGYTILSGDGTRRSMGNE